MIPHSDNFKKALLSPIKELFIKLEIFDNEMNYISEITKQVLSSDIGSISVDRNRPVRRNFSFTLNNKNGEFTWGDDKLIWIDKRVKVFTGLKLMDGTIEYIPQGVFIIIDPVTSHTSQGCTTSLSGQDKAYLLTDRRGRFENNTIIAEGINVATAIKTIAQAGGETLFLFDNVTETVPYELTFNESSNRWNAIEELAKFAKCEVFYDVNGYLRLKKVDDLNDLQNESAVWSFFSGDGFYSGSVRKMDETQTYNDFIALGGGTSSAVVRHQITVTESNPLFANSPYSIEKIGRITYFHNDGNADPLLMTEDDCKYRNKHSLMKYLGYAENVSVTTTSTFVLDASDIIEITDTKNNVQGRYMINQLNIPLKAEMVNMDCSKEIRVINDWSLL